MIEIIHGIETKALQSWLESKVSSHLTHDVSSYATGRQRVWLGIEPPLSSNAKAKPGLEISKPYWNRLEEIISWRFDYCLVTYSGKKQAIGITPHRDASFADYEAMGLNISGHCSFSYWNDRNSFGYSQSTGKCPANGPPSHIFELVPGDLVRFNCKNLHSARPSIDRWNMNFWRIKPK